MVVDIGTATSTQHRHAATPFDVSLAACCRGSPLGEPRAAQFMISLLAQQAGGRPMSVDARPARAPCATHQSPARPERTSRTRGAPTGSRTGLLLGFCDEAKNNSACACRGKQIRRNVSRQSNGAAAEQPHQG